MKTTSKMKITSKKDDLKNEDDLKKEDNLKNEDNTKNGDYLNMKILRRPIYEDDLKLKTTLFRRLYPARTYTSTVVLVIPVQQGLLLNIYEYFSGSNCMAVFKTWF